MNHHDVDTAEECRSFQTSLLRLIEALSLDRASSAEARGTFECRGPYEADRSVP